MADVNVVQRWEDGKPTPIPPYAKVRTHSGGGGGSTHCSQPCTQTITYKSGYSNLTTTLEPYLRLPLLVRITCNCSARGGRE